MLVKQFQRGIYRFIDKLCSQTGWHRQSVACLAGLFTVLALPPVHFFPICFFTFSILVRLFAGVAAQLNPERNFWFSVGIAALIGWSFGFGYFVGGLWWIGSALLLDVATYGWLIPFAIFGLPAFLSLFYAFASFFTFLIQQDGYGRVVVLSLSFCFAEWLRSFMFTGFPWNSIGYLAMPFPLLMQPVAVVGIYGMNVFAILVYAAPALLFEKKGQKLGLTIALLLIVADIGFGFYRFHSFDLSLQKAEEKNIRVRIIQPSIPLEKKINNTTLYKHFERHLSLSSSPPKNNHPSPQIIVWPETAIPFVLDESPEFLYRIGKSLNEKQFALIGTIRSEKEISIDESKTVRYFNSIHVVNSLGQRIAFADKVHLVPFGEYIPFISILHYLKMKHFTSITRNYVSADKHKSIRLTDGIVVFPLICYEVIFSSEMGYDGPKADLLVNITNDAWFGNTPGPWQHFAQARVQAVEQGLPLVRAANNGVSAIIDPLGRIVAMLPYNRIDFLDSEISFQKMSVSNKYSKFIPLGCACVVSFLGLMERIRNNGPKTMVTGFLAFI